MTTIITDTDIETLAKSIFSSMNESDKGRTSYLRNLVQTAQIGLPKKSDKEAQLVALQTVHERFYEIVLRAAEDYVPSGTKDRATELHRKAIFARTAASALRMHVRAGGNLANLKPDKVTKAGLRARAAPATPTARRLKGQAERSSKAILATLVSLSAVDKESAIAEIQAMLGQLTSQLRTLGVTPTTDAAQSTVEHRPLRIGKSLFIPIETTVPGMLQAAPERLIRIPAKRTGNVDGAGMQ